MNKFEHHALQGAENKGADQTARMRRLFCVFVGRVQQWQVVAHRGPSNRPRHEKLYFSGLATTCDSILAAKLQRLAKILEFWTHLSRMKFPTFINWANPFPYEGLLCDIFLFYSNSNRTLCKQTVETLIRRRVLRHLIWVSQPFSYEEINKRC